LTTSAGDKSEGFYNKDGSIQHGKIKALTRTYVKQAQGTIASMNFDTDSGKFVAEVDIDTTI